MDAHRSPRIPNFQKWMSGPFFVTFRRKSSPISAVNLADALKKAYKTVAEVKQCNLSKIKVAFKDRIEANNAARNPEFTALYHVHLPRQDVEVSGKIIDGGIDLMELRTKGAGKFEQPGLCTLPILECSRLARFSPDDNQYVLTDGIRVTFPGNILPEYVKFKNVWYPVRLFMPKQMFCKQCRNFGHTPKFCTHRLQKHTENHDNMCRFCNVAHTRIELCPVYKAKALQSGTRYRNIIKQNHQHASTLYKNPKYSASVTTTTTTAPAQVNNEIHLKRVATAPASAAARAAKQIDNAPQQRSSQPERSTRNSIPITLAELISTLCDACSVPPEWRALINAVMPVLQRLWNKILVKYPLLEIFVSS